MSVDILQEKIRKAKNPLILDLSFLPEHIPAHIRETLDDAQATMAYCCALINALKEEVVGVRFSFGQFAMMGPRGLIGLSELLTLCRQLELYTLLDSVEILTPWAADRGAATFFGADSEFSCDGLVLSPYIGTDGMKPFLPACKEGGKDLFFALRTANKSASDIQDLLTGSRHVHNAAADLVCRFGDAIVGKFGYSNLAGLASATAPGVLTDLRKRYTRLFLLVDGCDYPGGNARNAAYAFDRFGRGAAVCVGSSVTGAWYAAESDGRDFAEQAIKALERVKRNIARYVTIV